jgi:hypothetical protein
LAGKAMISAGDLERFEVFFNALVHRLARLAFAAREDDPLGAPAGGFGMQAVEDDFQGGGEALAGLAGEHADLEACGIGQPALLIGVERDSRCAGLTRRCHRCAR